MDLDRGFAVPPESARPWVYWFWLNGNLSKEGATADLEAMKRVGIAGVLIMSIDGGAAPGPVRFLTPEWRDLFRHVVAEATRLGITVDMNNDDGWDCGGPWIKPEDAAQKMVWTELQVEGPRKFSGTLAQPETALGHYRDIAVAAFPTPPGDRPDPSLPVPKRTSGGGAQPWVLLEFARPFTARALKVSVENRKLPLPACELQVSGDGISFRPVRRFETGWESVLAVYDSVTAAIPETAARYFRLIAHGTNPRNPPAFGFEMLAGARLHFWEMRAGFISLREHGGGLHLFLDRTPQAPARGAALDRNSVLDLGRRLDAAGRLEWDVPPGHWTILRIGHTPNGATNGFATLEGKGLDCDKLSRTGVEAHFPGMMGKLIDDVKPLAGKRLRLFHNDSQETGCQNWTPAFREEFRKRRGYDLFPYFPVMAGGRIVEGPEASERFLWDLRRTLSDLTADYYWEHLGTLIHRHGLEYSLEAAGRQQFLPDAINLLSRGDLPMGEFWATEQWTRPDCKLAASVAHGYGKKIAGAEAFTSGPGPTSRWEAHPFTLKMLGDHAFCAGVNHLVFHRYLHQPHLDRKGPGLTWNHIGINLERTQTWWTQGAAWMSYLSRCQFLLQRGGFVADLCYLAGEGVPNILVRRNGRRGAAATKQDASTITEIALARRGALPPAPPFGYDFDGVNPELILRMTVKDGRLALPSGMRYRALVLQPQTEMTPELLRKIAELVRAGATVVGPKPVRSPSLTNFPACDAEVRRLADEVWGGCDGKAVTEHACGKGRVVHGTGLAEVLAKLGAPPDFEYSGAEDADLDYVHRRDGGVEIYFVANRRNRAERVDCTFRVSGKAPEFWRPDTGGVERPALYTQKDGRTTLPLLLDPYGSVFVVFHGRASARSLAAARRDGAPAGVEARFTGAGKPALLAWEGGEYEFDTAQGGKLRAKVADLPAPLQAQGPWEVRFLAGMGAPGKTVFDTLVSWTKRPEPGVKHYSGTAVYQKEIAIPAALLGPDRLLDLDLGKVAVIAEVRLNGRDLGTLWKPPFRLDVSRAAKPGRNVLEVRVTNLWPNRMIGDQALPENERSAWCSWAPFKKDAPLLESGLLGPVRLVPGKLVSL